jgi:hypothetical protein
VLGVAAARFTVGGEELSPSLFRRPSAVIPLGMSCIALLTVLIHMLHDSGGPTSGDEPAAHLFQLLMAGQGPFVAFFALKWMPRMPSQAMHVIAMQAAAALVALAPVVFFDL